MKIAPQDRLKYPSYRGIEVMLYVNELSSAGRCKSGRLREVPVLRSLTVWESIILVKVDKIAKVLTATSKNGKTHLK